MEPMSHISIQYYHKNNRQIQIVKEANLIQQFFKIRSNFNKIILGQAIVEIIDKSTSENNAIPIIYRLGWRILDKMNKIDVDHRVLFAFFLYQLALRLGFMPNINTCYQCNSKLIRALINEQTGELSCNNCNPNSNLILNDNSILFLQELAILHLDKIQYQKYNSLEILNVLTFLDIFTYIHIEGMKNVRSLKMVKKIIAI